MYASFPNIRDFIRNEIQDKLFNQIKAEFKKLGYTSLYDALHAHAPAATQTEAQKFTKLLTDMDPQQAAALADKLQSAREEQVLTADWFQGIFQPGKPGHDEFKHFVENNSIQCIAKGNSVNFLVTPSVGSSPYIIRLAKQERPRIGETYLREQESMQGAFVPLMTNRDTYVQNEGAQESRSIQVMGYSPRGNIEALSRSITSEAQRITTALDVFPHMAETLVNIGQLDCAFPDLKNSNWIMDENGAPIISDSKSLIRLQGKDFIPSNCLRTPLYSGPEFFTAGAVVNPDNAHAFILGANIHQFLTQEDRTCRNNEESGMIEVDPFTFTSPVFDSNEGKALKELIQQLTKTKPEDRIPVSEALIILKNMKKTSFQKNNRSQLEDLHIKLDTIASYRFGDGDQAMSHFVAEQRDKINSATSMEELDAISINVDDTLNSLNKKFVFLTDNKPQVDALLEKLNEIYSLRFGNDDAVMNEFVKENTKKIKSATTIEELTAISNTLDNTLKQVKSPESETVRTIINKFREAFFGSKMKKLKALHIEQAMANVPLEARGCIMMKKENTDPHTKAKVQAVRLALARHRSDGSVAKDTTGEIDEKRSADSFKNFKNKLAKVTKEMENKESPKPVDNNTEKFKMR